MDLNAPLSLVERPQGAGALLAYLVGLAIGTLVALPILALFGIAIPMP
jgi:hypothetical protein